MSQEEEVVIMAIAQPAQGKTERFKELIAEALEWIKANEPSTLEFSIYEQKSDEGDGIKLLFFERYASQAAMDSHESTENYQNFFSKVVEEELLQGAPVISKGKLWRTFRR